MSSIDLVTCELCGKQVYMEMSELVSGLIIWQGLCFCEIEQGIVGVHVVREPFEFITIKFIIPRNNENPIS